MVLAFALGALSYYLLPESIVRVGIETSGEISFPALRFLNSRASWFPEMPDSRRTFPALRYDPQQICSATAIRVCVQIIDATYYLQPYHQTSHFVPPFGPTLTLDAISPRSILSAIAAPDDEHPPRFACKLEPGQPYSVKPLFVRVTYVQTIFNATRTIFVTGMAGKPMDFAVVSGPHYQLLIEENF